jgi:hypothetical protein
MRSAFLSFRADRRPPTGGSHRFHAPLRVGAASRVTRVSEIGGDDRQGFLVDVVAVHARLHGGSDLPTGSATRATRARCHKKPSSFSQATSVVIVEKTGGW